MALDTVNAADVLQLDNVPLNSNRFSKGVIDDDDGEVKDGFRFPKFVVLGHRGSGMNMLQSDDEKLKLIKENSILSFNAASNFPLDFVEFDVQVTKDDCPIIYHDNFILAKEKDDITEKRVTDLTLAEFLSYGPQGEAENGMKLLYRKLKDGRIFEWKVERDDPFCTLLDVFQKVNHPIGFNIELKFDDHIVYEEEELVRILKVILKVVFEHAKDRPIIFSSFQPDAARLIRKLQTTYPVFFLTNGGSEIFADMRRNSIDEAIKVCLAGGLQGIVSEVKAIFRNHDVITKIKRSNLAILTYGQLNNVAEVVHMQHRMGVEGVIVDLVKEITEVVISGFNVSIEEKEGSKDDKLLLGEEGNMEIHRKLRISEEECSFMLEFIPEINAILNHE